MKHRCSSILCLRKFLTVPINTLTVSFNFMATLLSCTHISEDQAPSQAQVCTMTGLSLWQHHKLIWNLSSLLHWKYWSQNLLYGQRKSINITGTSSLWGKCKNKDKEIIAKGEHVQSSAILDNYFSTLIKCSCVPWWQLVRWSRVIQSHSNKMDCRLPHQSST